MKFLAPSRAHKRLRSSRQGESGDVIHVAQYRRRRFRAIFTATPFCAIISRSRPDRYAASRRARVSITAARFAHHDGSQEARLAAMRRDFAAADAEFRAVDDAMSAPMPIDEE